MSIRTLDHYPNYLNSSNELCATILFFITNLFFLLRESGVRNLRKQIEKIYRKVGFKVRNLLGLAISRTFGSDSDPYKNPLKNKAD